MRQAQNPRGAKRKLTAQEIKVVLQLANAGFSQRQIARTMGVSPSSVSRIIGRERRPDKPASYTWDAIAEDPERYFREAESTLLAYIEMCNAWDEKVTSGPPGVERDDWEILLAQRDRVISAHHAEWQRRRNGDLFEPPQLPRLPQGHPALDRVGQSSPLCRHHL